MKTANVFAYSKKQSPWEAKSSSDIKEFPYFSRKTKVYYFDLNGPPLVPILNQINLIHNTKPYTGCPGRNVPDFGRVFLMLKYTNITQNNYVQSRTVTEIMAREECCLLAGPRTVPVSW